MRNADATMAITGILWAMTCSKPESDDKALREHVHPMVRKLS